MPASSFNDTRHHLYSSGAYDKFHHRIEKKREELKRLDVEVIDIKVSKSLGPDYIPRYISSAKDNITEPVKEYYEARFAVAMSEGAVTDLIDLPRTVDSLHREIDAANYARRSAEEAHLSLRNKIGKLKQVLHENPSLKTQWGEFVVMLKMAGFDLDSL